MKKSFYSHGKLLITAEYLVLDGVTALAIPTQKGQWLHIEENESDNQIIWKSYDDENLCWFETVFRIVEDKVVATTTNEDDDAIIKILIDILNTAKEMNPNFLSSGKGYLIENKLEFNRFWGLGSSSTLINNIAQWAKINAFTLLDKSFGGSGYDIACAQHDTPVLYNRNEGNPIVTEVNFDPPFKDQIYFVYLNQKQDSKEAIKHYHTLPLKDFDKAAKEVKEITDRVMNSISIEEFKQDLATHEEIISKILKTPSSKTTLFEDYTGTIKSLGGWGGDFIMTTGTKEDMNYFKDKGYHTIIPYSDMILKKTTTPQV